jgi:penicillin-binding protein 1B
MVGGRDYGSSQFNRAVNARRQPGSSFKPIVALAALSQRDGPTLATVLQDEPLSVETPAGLWEPTNYDGEFRGGVTMREALERSLNVPFARLGLDVGPERIVETGRKLGLESRLVPVPSLALGASEVTPLEMTRAFGVFAAGGYRSDVHTTLGVLDSEGEVLSRYELGGEQVYTAAETYLVTSALRGAVERGTGRSLRNWGFRSPVAAKSGTTNDFRDAWFIGYTPSLVVGVWVGFDDGRSTNLTGSRAALPIVALFLRGALGSNGAEEFSMPSGLEVVSVNRETGLRAGYRCRGEREVFLRGTAPRESCSWYRSYTNRNGNSRSRNFTVVPPLRSSSRRGSRGSSQR